MKFALLVVGAVVILVSESLAQGGGGGGGGGGAGPVFLTGISRERRGGDCLCGAGGDGPGGGGYLCDCNTPGAIHGTPYTPPNGRVKRQGGGGGGGGGGSMPFVLTGVSRERQVISDTDQTTRGPVCLCGAGGPGPGGGGHLCDCNTPGAIHGTPYTPPNGK